jgi:hypothetical protein
MGNTVSGQELPSVDAATLARWLGVPPKTIYDLTKAGVLERGVGRTFEIEISVRKYCEHLRRRVGEASVAQAMK